MTARDIQRRIIVDRYRRHFCVANYTPKGWFECDVCCLTDAGYMHEFEVKLTAGDFKADAKKARQLWRMNGGRMEWYDDETKHQRLARRDARGPSEFWFCLPTGLVVEVPDWAGVIRCTERPTHNPPWNVHIETERPAPRLHDEKFNPKIREHAQSVCYYRMHNLFLHKRMSTEATLTDVPV